MNRRYALPTAGLLTLLVAAALVPAMKTTIDNGLASDARVALVSDHLPGVEISSHWANLTLTGPAAAQAAALSAVHRMPHSGSVHTVTYDCVGAGCAHVHGTGSAPKAASTPETGNSGQAPPAPSTSPAAGGGPSGGSGLTASAAQRKIDSILGSRGITFDFGGARLTPGDLALLRQVAAVLARAPKISATLSGYTDSWGTAAVNVPLSRERAQAAENYLAARGVTASRMTTRGLGAADPVASNSTSAGRAANRRVGLTVQGD
jgi:outer membrane protein OmpA-like peptidoglycan-associated protein